MNTFELLILFLTFCVSYFSFLLVYYLIEMFVKKYRA